MIKEGVMISGRYQIMGRIGTGGMADVYKAMDHKLNRYVAVKVLKHEFREDELFVKKFRTEAQSAAGLTHPNIVNVYDVGEDRGLYYIVMELVEGITLKDYIKKKSRLTPKEVISIAVQVCSGIEEAHEHNIIHRDIKPQNIIISKEGKVKVTDFGIAKATSSNTISTNAMGSVHYTSPEQARGGFSDAKSDIYSLGITMYEMITGELPFDGDSTVSIALKHLQEDIVAPSELVPDIPYSLEQIIIKCTQKSPDRRYAEVSLLAKDLRRSLSDPDGDFVVIAPFTNVGDTVMITPEELSRIQSASEKESDYDDYEYDDDVYDYEEERPKRRKTTTINGKEIDPKLAKIMKILTGVVAAIFIFMLIFFIGKAAGLWKMGFDIPGESDKNLVPVLVGMTEEEAEEACEKESLKLKVVDRVLSEKYDEGYVIEQKTQENTKLPEGATVNVVVSSGLKGEEIEIPEVKNMTESQARKTLIDKGFQEANIKVSEVVSDDVEVGKVVGTTPEQGEKGTQETQITIYISKGTEKAYVPYLIGKNQKDAEATLKSVGLKGHYTEKYSSSPVGEVIDQAKESGEKVDKGTTIEYVISKGEKPVTKVTIPTGLEGKSYDSVKTALTNIGLVPNPSYAYNDKYAVGEVIHVEGAGVAAEEGSYVNVVISKGPEVSDVPEDSGSTEATQ